MRSSKRLLTLLIAVAFAAGLWLLNARGPNEQQVLDTIEPGVSLNTFLTDQEALDEWYYLFAYEADGVRYRTFEEARNAGATFGMIVIDARKLNDLREIVRAGKLDDEKFTGVLQLRRARWFNGPTVIDLTFVDGKLVSKELGKMFLGSRMNNEITARSTSTELAFVMAY